jgi:hypothetical protein
MVVKEPQKPAAKNNEYFASTLKVVVNVEGGYLASYLQKITRLFLPNPFIALLFVFLLYRSPRCFMSDFFSTLAFASASFCRILILFYCIGMRFLENVLSMFR